MPAQKGDYTDCSILIYDKDGNHLNNTVVTSHDKVSLRVEVEEPPPSLGNGDGCRLLILTSPSPREYQGRVVREGHRLSIAMFQGRENEKRGAVRYNVNFSALIENLICDGRAHPLHTPLEVELINISKSGVRFRAPYYSLTEGDRFQIRMKIGDGEKLLIVDVVNYKDREDKTSEYGCKFLIGSERAV
jgi:hypothetical protein